MTGLLLWAQWRQWVHTWLSRRRVPVIIAIALAALSFATMLTFFGYAIGRNSSLDALRPVAGLALPAVVIVVILADLPQVYGQLYVARDVELLFTLPIPTRSIFLVKYLQTLIVGNLLTIPLILIPLIGLGIGAGAHLLYYPAVVLVVFVVVAGAVAISYLMMLTLVRFLPRKRLNEIIVASQALTGLIAALAGQLFRFSDQLDRAPDVLPVAPIWLPTTWGAIALERLGRADPFGILPALGVIATSGVLLLLSMRMVERGFRLGWVRISEGSGRKRQTRARSAAYAPPRGPIAGIAVKEITMLRRDIRQWMSLLPMIVLFGIGLFQFIAGGGWTIAREYPSATWFVVQSGLVTFMIFAGTAFAAPAFALDGLAAWVLRTAPLSGWQIALGKFLVYWGVLAGLVIAADLIAAVVLRWSLLQAAGGVVVAVVLLTGAVALQVWIGTFGVRYDPQNPHNQLRTGIGFLVIGVSVVYFLVALLPVLLTLLPTSLEPLLADDVASASGWAATVGRALLAVVRLKIAHPVLTTGLGVLWLIATGLGIAAFALWRTARRVDAGIQIEIVQQG
ncbi:putative ABC transporter permease subunit [Sphaerobacter thermophilus]|uniref:ABC-2 type transport system permease protein n=1 Tax=Sphaerobacter thermophilus (strain ATCC 49802 / DSM 20745 / KCCM 41009 / NCIMB 13125 / S 6022) TaxID=479434 RepID=D1C7A4_SPHTD|nr:hypothetical protein [Sphaerobacter thermophilus]ACZ39750.1 hypothetical protein Sthe_2329 [Sphaerobacter thermophilus DSM 20745]